MSIVLGTTGHQFGTAVLFWCQEDIVGLTRVPELWIVVLLLEAPWKMQILAGAFHY